MLLLIVDSCERQPLSVKKLKKILKKLARIGLWSDFCALELASDQTRVRSNRPLTRQVCAQTVQDKSDLWSDKFQTIAQTKVWSKFVWSEVTSVWPPRNGEQYNKGWGGGNMTKNDHGQLVQTKNWPWLEVAGISANCHETFPQKPVFVWSRVNRSTTIQICASVTRPCDQDDQNERWKSAQLCNLRQAWFGGTDSRRTYDYESTANAKQADRQASRQKSKPKVM